MLHSYDFPTIFIDLDGVVADFERFYEEAFQHRHDSVSDEEMWKNINAHGKFFSSLPLIEGAVEFIKRFRKTHNIVILTACPKSDYQRAALQKKEWFKKFVADDLMILPVLGGKNKFLFMQKPGDVLIDDFAKNVTPWVEGGGFGVVHTNWADTTEVVANYLYGVDFINHVTDAWNNVEDRLEKLAFRLNEEGRYVDRNICEWALIKLKERAQ